MQKNILTRTPQVAGPERGMAALATCSLQASGSRRRVLESSMFCTVLHQLETRVDGVSIRVHPGLSWNLSTHIASNLHKSRRKSRCPSTEHSNGLVHTTLPTSLASAGTRRGGVVLGTRVVALLRGCHRGCSFASGVNKSMSGAARLEADKLTV